MPNHRRGEMAVTIAGRSWTLCLTLGALAEIESHFGVTDLPALGVRLAEGRLGARDIIAIMSAAARGGGMTMDDAGMAMMPADALPQLMDAIITLFAHTFPPEPAVTQNPLPPQGA